MKLNLLVLALATATAITLGTGIARSDDEKPEPAKPSEAKSDDGAVPQMPDMSDPEFQKRIMAVTSPGAMHKKLEYYIGDWDVTIASTMMPGEPTKATATFAWKIPGRWVTHEMKGTMMGRPYHGFGIIGFDNYRKCHVSTFVSNFDTSMSSFSGPVVDPSHKVSVEYGTMNEYLNGTLGKFARVVTRQIDQNTFELEIWDMQIGESGKPVLEFRYTRKKQEPESK